MRIRPAVPEDVPTLAGIAERSYRFGFSAIIEAEALAQRDAAFFAARFTELLWSLRVAETDRVLAFAMIRDGHIDMLFADPDAIGRGAGGALLGALEAEGARSLECFSANHAARRFYERRGWRVERAYVRPFLGRERDFVLYIRDFPGGH